MTLVEANKGDTVKVVNVPTGVLRAQMVRLGISEGSEVTCVLKIPAGPVVVRQGNLEVALGKKIASGIEVSKVRCINTRRHRHRFGRGQKRLS